MIHTRTGCEHCNSSVSTFTDPSCLSSRGYPTIFEDDEKRRYVVTMVTDGEHGESDAVRGQLGRTKVDKILMTDDTIGGIRIPRKLKLDAFWDMLEECCQTADKQSALNA